MASFYEKLSAKIQGEQAGQGPKDPPPATAKSVSYNAAGAKTSPAPKNDPAADPPAEAPPPEGSDPLMVDLFESEGRMVIFAQASGVTPEDLEVVADEESNTVLIQAAQKRPALPPVPGAPAGSEQEKGRFVKQEIKWDPSLYRKVYLPAPFDAGGTDTYLAHGVLVIVLPVKRPGTGKKLSVRELKGEEPKK